MAQEVTVTQLNYWVLFSGGDARPMQLMVEKFNSSQKNTNVKMRIIRWADYYPTLNQNIKTKDAPDVCIIHASLLPFYVDQNVLTDLTPYGIKWENIPTHLKNAVQFDEKYYALPLDMHPQVFYFNKKYLAQANLLGSDGKPIMESGVDGFVEFLKKLKKSLPSDIYPISTPNRNVLIWWMWYSLYSQQENSGYIVNNKVAFNNKAARDAFEFFYKIRESKVWDEEIHDEKGYNLFKFNKAATMITGVWTTWNFQQNSELDFGVEQFPKLFEKSANFGDSHTFAILKTDDCQKQKAAADFIKWMSENSYDWAISGQVPANKKVLDSKEFKELPFRDIYAKSANDMMLYPKSLKLKKCNDEMIDILAEFLQSSDSVEDVINKAQVRLTKILEQ